MTRSASSEEITEVAKWALRTKKWRERNGAPSTLEDLERYFRWTLNAVWPEDEEQDKTIVFIWPRTDEVMALKWAQSPVGPALEEIEQ